MSRWTHAICEPCWTHTNPDRQAITLRDAERTDCCYCGVPTTDGIYVRDDPAPLACSGKHKEAPETSHPERTAP